MLPILVIPSSKHRERLNSEQESTKVYLLNHSTESLKSAGRFTKVSFPVAFVPITTFDSHNSWSRQA
jgi:hypothetical protein